jgi:hypothetical protein
LREINEQVNTVSEVRAKIASASDQQSQGIDQITVAVQQMSDMTQQNAANSEESAASAVELDSLAHKVQKMVDAFRQGDQQAIHTLPKGASADRATLGKPRGSGRNNDKGWRPNGREGRSSSTLDDELTGAQRFLAFQPLDEGIKARRGRKAWTLPLHGNA